MKGQAPEHPHRSAPGAAEGAGGDGPAVLRAAERSGDARLLQGARAAMIRLGRNPRDAEALQALGMVAGRCKRREAAVRLIRRAIGCEPARIDFVGNLGTVFQDMGRFDDAIACYRQVLAAAPGNEVAHNNLGNTLQERGDLEDAVAAYRAALSSRPGYLDAWINLGNTLQKLDRTEEALAAFQRALEIRPDHPPALVNLGTTYQQAGQDEEAIACFRRALALNPASVQARNKLFRLHLERGEADALESQIREIRRHQPDNQMAIACEAFAALARGERARFEDLYGRDDLLHTEDLAPPAEWPDTAAFNRALVAEIEGHPSFKWIHDSYDTTWRGFVQGLLDDPGPTIGAFGALIGAAVERLKASLPDEPAHPFFGRVPRDYSIDLWATILNQGGYHPPHHHEGNWLSGTYYARVPERPETKSSDKAPDARPAGAGPAWIVFDGFTGLPGVTDAESYVHAIEPREGLLVLFPSYFMHQTVPFSGGDQRISLAFDIKPLS